MLYSVKLPNHLWDEMFNKLVQKYNEYLKRLQSNDRMDFWTRCNSSETLRKYVTQEITSDSFHWPEDYDGPKVMIDASNLSAVKKFFKNSSQLPPWITKDPTKIFDDETLDMILIEIYYKLVDSFFDYVYGKANSSKELNEWTFYLFGRVCHWVDQYPSTIKLKITEGDKRNSSSPKHQVKKIMAQLFESMFFRIGNPADDPRFQHRFIRIIRLEKYGRHIDPFSAFVPSFSLHDTDGLSQAKKRRKKLAEKNEEIKQLMKKIEDRDEEITRLKKKLEELESNYVKEDKSWSK